ncbi:MAG TPA: hypothetical protein VMX15_04145 [Candidatus Heimdallarchaeota archaeon]|nr:hypothetical protein [Candidatus Heimdallarchaeota archaeon]
MDRPRAQRTWPLKHLEVVADGGTGYFTRSSKAGRLEDATALRNQQLNKLLERGASFQTEQLLNILRPIGVHPFLKVPLRQTLGQEELRQPSTQEAAVEILAFKSRKIGQHHRRKPQIAFAPSQGISEFR